MKVLTRPTKNGSSSNAPVLAPDEVPASGRRIRRAGVVAAAIAAAGAAVLGVIALIRTSVSPLLLVGSWLLAVPLLVFVVVRARRLQIAAGRWTSRARSAVLACVLAVVLLTANTVYVAAIKSQTCAQRVGVGASVAGCNLAHANLRAHDLRRANLSGANLSGAVLTKANLSGADLRGANLSGARLTGANLGAARLDRANLTKTALVGLDLRRVGLRRANLVGADLNGADLSGAVLTKASLSGANLRGARLTGTDMSDANLSRTNLDFLDLSGATLRGATLDGASMRRAALSRADFTGARLNGVNLDWATLGGAVGLGDAQLSSAMGVPTDQLGRAVKEHGLQLESQQSVLAALSPACSGTPVAGARTVPGATFHPMGIVGLTQMATWSPPALRFAELVACVDADTSSVVEVCPYVSMTTGQEATVTRFQHARHVRVVNAATGATVADQTLQGPPPNECPEVTSSLSPIGTAVANGDVTNFLAPFVGSVPTVVATPTVPAPALAVTVTPRSAAPGTTVTVTARDCAIANAILGNLVQGSRIVATATGGTTGAGIIRILVPFGTTPGTYQVQLTCFFTTTGQRHGTVPLEVTKKTS